MDINTMNKAEQLLSERPHKTYYVVTEGATTKNGGVVQARYNEIGYATIHEKRIATVGDVVVYPDGSTAKTFVAEFSSFKAFPTPDKCPPVPTPEIR